MSVTSCLKDHPLIGEDKVFFNDVLQEKKADGLTHTEAARVAVRELEQSILKEYEALTDRVSQMGAQLPSLVSDEKPEVQFNKRSSRLPGGVNATEDPFEKASGSRETGKGTSPEVTLLNETLNNHFKKGDWSNAFQEGQLSDLDSGLQSATEAAFGGELQIVPVTATHERFNVLNGIKLQESPDKIYVNTESDVDFLGVAWHEIGHVMQQKRPELYEFMVEQLQQYADLYRYGQDLAKNLEKGEKAPAIGTIQSELLSDFIGDSMGDAAFLQQMADSNPSKFKQLLTYFRQWLSKIVTRLKNNGSSEYISDIETMRGHLKNVLNAFVDGKDLSEVQTTNNNLEQHLVQFMVAYHGSPHQFDEFDHSKMGSGEGAQMYGWGTYLAEKKGVAEWYRDQLSGSESPKYNGMDYID